MSARPAYFEPIRERAARRWDQLEDDPELAAPWHQLFIQVQSPRHVLSELLQNADDAGATEARVAIEDGAFVFRHNGEDFTEEHFASLCRFGYSNKRALHTIGFRGIEFKSTFSLGEKVELLTPSLSLDFHKQRFTEPRWIERPIMQGRWTTVRVQFSDSHLRKAVEDSFSEWLKSPLSLLFFRNIRRVKIGDGVVHWHSEGPGPIEGSEWFSLDSDRARRHLFARSKPEALPQEALAEIRKERMVAEAQELEFPPCQVELIMGAEGRLFVVLPTGVKTDLPFSCNAPFLQDAARYKIKDPAQSPTNRWLLERIGKLAGTVLLEWLNRKDLSAQERANAHNIMPDVDRSASTLEGVCAAIVEKSFEEVIADPPILLTDNGQLVDSSGAVVLPRELFEVWPQEQVSSFFDEDERPPLSHHISERNIKKLKNWNAIEEVDHQDVLNVLQQRRFPRPQTWRQLLTLWSYVDQRLKSYEYYCEEDALRIVPVQGKDVLFAASEVIRLGEKRIIPSEEDWQFLGDRISVLNQNWMRFLSEQRRQSESEKDKVLHKLVEAADHVLEEIGLDEPSDTGKVIDTVASGFFSEKNIKLTDAIRLAHVAAKLGAQTGDSFKFACQDRRLRSLSKTVLIDQDGSLGILLPDEWAEEHLLHPDYTKFFKSCSREEWEVWIASGRAGLGSFVPLEQTSGRYWSEKQLRPELVRRNLEGTFKPRYSNPSFTISDWDFDDDFWEHWEALAPEVPSIWGRIVEKVLAQPGQWSSRLTATVTERASNGAESRCVRDGLAPAWIMKLREKPCLRDTQGNYRKPDELLMRTHETEALMDIEPFVHGLLDVEATKPILRLLGVSNKPTGPDKLLLRLATLSKSDTPPPHEVEKWYRRLDQLIDGCSTEAFLKVREAFEADRLILAEDGSWQNVRGVFLAGGDEDVPGAPVIRASVRDLSLWRKLGIGDRPTADLAIAWLTTLESGMPLPAEDLRRTKALLARYPARVWTECGHWLSLGGEWLPVEEFAYALSMQSLTHWAHLHPWVKQKSADLRALSAESVDAPPFDILPSLASVIEEQFSQHGRPAGHAEERAWLTELGCSLRRIKLDDEEETARVRELGAQLAGTRWVTCSDIEITPYIGGKPAGTARRADVLWQGSALYAEDRPLARLAKSAAQEIGKAFRRTEIIDAIKLCFDRPADFVSNYMEENFDLVPPEEIEERDSQSEQQGAAAPAVGSQQAEDQDSTNDPSSETIVHEADSEDDEDFAGDDNAELVNKAEPEENESPVAEEPEPEEEPDDAPLPAPRKPRETKAPIIERFALAKGFRKDGDSHFYNDQGQIIGRANGSLFPWELRSPAGDVSKRYWPKDHCLELEPLPLDAAIWGVLEQHPDSYVLVLANADGDPVEVTGKLLTELRDRGVLALHPSTYRLVIEHDKDL
ncbi:sacsin N-terminal ATP-binding-like domain-containing protein [Seohaeicola zhoushanensis]